jgi:hypothetical protein
MRPSSTCSTLILVRSITSLGLLYDIIFIVSLFPFVLLTCAFPLYVLMHIIYGVMRTKRSRLSTARSHLRPKAERPVRRKPVRSFWAGNSTFYSMSILISLTQCHARSFSAVWPDPRRLDRLDPNLLWRGMAFGIFKDNVVVCSNTP